jgi:hypothetical protein
VAQNTILEWIDGRGWLILSHAADDEIRGRALQRVSADGHLACVVLDGDLNAGEALLEDLESLGAQSGYLVDVLSEDDQTLDQRLSDASIVVLIGASSPNTARSALTGVAVQAIQRAYANGAVILLEGASANAFGQWIVQADRRTTEGFAWLKNCFVFANAVPIVEQKTLLAAQTPSFALEIGAQSAIVLGPDGQVELWGEQKVTFRLGSGIS